MSAICVPRPALQRTASRARSRGSPIASRTGDALTVPEVQAAPVDTATPARSRACTTSSPGAPSSPALTTPGRRAAPPP